MTEMRPGGGSTAPFDAQAAAFDRRAGLPPGVEEAVAHEVLACAFRTLPGLRRSAPGGSRSELLLDLGAGTGRIGVHLAATAAAAGLGYLGLDLSSGMLARFRRRSAGGDAAAEPATPAAPHLLAADGDRPWPLVPGCCRVIFASRAAHLLSAEIVAREVLRAAAPGGAILVLGWVRRRPGSVRQALRRQMHELLAERGVQARSGNAERSRLLDMLEEYGATFVPPVSVASWEVVERPADSLAGWRGKPGLAGKDVHPELQRDVLDRLEAWAGETFGPLDREFTSSESYQLSPLRLPAS